jgi:diguanylate cyclase (GGDEF)-like protein/PAS domain S-box-containing protein
MLGTEVATFLDACSLAAIVIDTDESVVFANRAAQEMLNDAQLAMGCAISDLVPDWPVERYSSRSIMSAGKQQLCRLRPVMWSGTTGPITALLIKTDDEGAAALALREANLRLRYVIDMLPQAMCVFDAKDRYVLWNQKYAELYADIAEHLEPGVAFEEILKISLASGNMQEFVSDESAWLVQRMEKFRQPNSQEEQRLRDGRWLRHDDRRTPDGGAIGIRIDITELKEREDWLRQLFDANPMPMLLCNGDSLAILEANSAAVDFYGVELSTLTSRNAFDMHADSDSEEFSKRLRNLDGDCEARTVWRQYDAKGNERHVLIYVRFLYEGTDRRLLLTIADVSERVLAENEANRLAHHDLLTGLANRMQYYKALDNALSANEVGNVVVHCLDLDGFKPVNDTFGHAVGDDVLKIVAERLQREAKGHIVARLGGDEFAIMQRSAADSGAALANRCLAAFDAPFLIKGLSIRLGVSIGIAVASHTAQEGEGLMQAADRALYRAKAEGRNTWRIAGDERKSVRLSAPY